MYLYIYIYKWSLLTQKPPNQDTKSPVQVMLICGSKLDRPVQTQPKVKGMSGLDS